MKEWMNRRIWKVKCIALHVRPSVRPCLCLSEYSIICSRGSKPIFKIGAVQFHPNKQELTGITNVGSIALLFFFIINTEKLCTQYTSININIYAYNTNKQHQVRHWVWNGERVWSHSTAHCANNVVSLQSVGLLYRRLTMSKSRKSSAAFSLERRHGAMTHPPNGPEMVAEPSE